MKLMPSGAVLLLLLLGCKKEVKVEAGERTGDLSLIRARHSYYLPLRHEGFQESVNAAFFRALSPNSKTTIDAGSVQYGDSVLHNNNQLYSSSPSNSPIFIAGFNPGFDGGKMWQITGKAGGAPAFTTPAAPFPTFLSKTIDTLTMVSATRPFTLSWDNSLPCDTMAIILGRVQVIAYKMEGNLSSFTFPANDLANWIAFNGTEKTIVTMVGTSTKEVIVDGIKVEVSTRAERSFEVQPVR